MQLLTTLFLPLSAPLLRVHAGKAAAYDVHSSKDV